MESNYAAFVTVLLALVLIVALPVDMRRNCRQRVRIDWKSHAELFVDEGEFQKCYKMSYASLNALARKLEPYLTTDEQQSRNRTGIEPITHINKLQMCLRWLSGGSCHDIRTNSGVSVAAFYISVHQVIDAIISHPELQLKFPETVPTPRHASKSFERLSS